MFQLGKVWPSSTGSSTLKHLQVSSTKVNSARGPTWVNSARRTTWVNSARGVTWVNSARRPKWVDSAQFHLTPTIVLTRTVSQDFVSFYIFGPKTLPDHLRKDKQCWQVFRLREDICEIGVSTKSWNMRTWCMQHVHIVILTDHTYMDTEGKFSKFKMVHWVQVSEERLILSSYWL